MFLMSTAATPPDGTTLGIIITGLTGIVIAVLSFFTARFTARQSTKVSEASNSNPAQTTDVANWRSLIETLQSEVHRVQERVGGLETEGEGYRARIGSLETEVRNREIKYRVSLSYIHELTQWVKENIGINKPLPPVPHELADDVKI